MMSREFDYNCLNNLFSILLSQMRSHLTPLEFRILLNLQRASAEWVETNLFTPRFEDLWLAEMRLQIDEGFEWIALGKIQKHRVRALFHLMQHLFLNARYVPELIRVD